MNGTTVQVQLPGNTNTGQFDITLALPRVHLQLTLNLGNPIVTPSWSYSRPYGWNAVCLREGPPKSDHGLPTVLLLGIAHGF